MKLLLLGGTADARHLTEALYARGLCDPARAGAALQITYSIAGLVRTPDLPCRVISGGFSQHGGLEAYLRQNGIDLLLDVTHPFAARMSSTAVAAAAACGIPCWRFQRPAWEAQPGDRWQLLADWEGLVPALATKRSVLLTAGQLDQPLLDRLVAQAGGQQRLILRTAAPPRTELPESVIWLKAIGPFQLADETALLRQYQVDALVTKNSGGASTEAKLHAARALGIEVFMLQRPSLPPALRQFDDIVTSADAIEARLVASTQTRPAGRNGE